jgi:phosphatidylinositol 4-kinase B
LKRFDSQKQQCVTPTTPKQDVEQIVNSVAQEQLLKEIRMPAIPPNPMLLPSLEDGKIGKESPNEADSEDETEFEDALAEEGEEEEETIVTEADTAGEARPSVNADNITNATTQANAEATGRSGVEQDETPDVAREMEQSANDNPAHTTDTNSEACARPLTEATADPLSKHTGEAQFVTPKKDPFGGNSMPVQRGSSAGITGEDSGTKSRRTTSLDDSVHRSGGGRKVSTLGSITSSQVNDAGEPTNTLAPTGDIRRAVLTTIMMRGLQGNTIAAGAADSVQRSLKELERKRATELILMGDDSDSGDRQAAVEDDNEKRVRESTRQRLVSLGLGASIEDADMARPSEEDEVLEAIRLILIQNRVAQGHLSPADAAKVLQHTSLSPINRSNDPPFLGERMDLSDYPTIDAGDVEPRLIGCGPLPPAVLQAMTLWKGGMVTHAELLELVKKDIEFVKHSILVDAEIVDKLKENSAFWGRFAFGERWAEKKSRISSSSPQGTMPGWDMMGVIVKSNDDLRQEAFVMQLIELCQEAFELAGLELWVAPYRILATGRTTGVIECVRNAMSFDALKKRPGYGKGGLREHLQRMTEFTADPGGAFKSAQRNFVRSLAAYSLMSYLFLIKDRHNGNLLLDTAGHVIHIDFGFVFGIAPGGSFSLEMSTPFKLTEEMLDVMGGLRSPLFSEFVTLFCCGFLALQSHCDTFLTLVEITSRDSTFKCFEGRDPNEMVSKFRERFCPDLDKEDTISYALDLIKQATTSYGTRQYDLYQYLSQGIVT